MFTDLKPYPEYEDTGVPWIGAIPLAWRAVRSKTLMWHRAEQVGEAINDYQLLSLTKRGVIRRNLDKLEGKIPASFTNYQIVRNDDLIFCLFDIDETPRTVGLVLEAGMITGAYSRFEAKNSLLAQYLVYFFESVDEAKGLRSLYSGLRKVIKTSTFLDARVPLPPPAEQAAIVKYLGHANARVSQAIAAKRKLIALLEEHKQTVINQAVTRGLDPNVSMKDSGIPWIGQIPTHWDVIPTGAAARMIQTGPFGSQLHAAEYIGGGIPVINPSHFSGTGITADPAVSVSRSKAGELARHRLTDGDLIAARRGELGRCAVVGQREDGWICGTGSLIIRLRSDTFCPSYFQLLFSSQQTKAQLEAGSVGATMSNLNAQMVVRLRIPKPVLEEQRVIVAAVNSEVEKGARRIAAVTREIQLLREFQTRLTADVVTGQLDIRAAAARLPDVDPADLMSDPVEPDEDALDAELAEILEEADA